MGVVLWHKSSLLPDFGAEEISFHNFCGFWPLLEIPLFSNIAGARTPIKLDKETCHIDWFYINPYHDERCSYEELIIDADQISHEVLTMTSLIYQRYINHQEPILKPTISKYCKPYKRPLCMRDRKFSVLHISDIHAENMSEALKTFLIGVQDYDDGITACLSFLPDSDQRVYKAFDDNGGQICNLVANYHRYENHWVGVIPL